MVRQRARDALVKIGRTAAPAIGRTLRDPNPQVRWTAALMLGNIASEQTVPALIEALSDADWMVRNEASVALARTRSDASVTPMEEYPIRSLSRQNRAAQCRRHKRRPAIDLRASKSILLSDPQNSS
ncbi:MAG: HEAT repeat domain-containing protein [Acidobacteriia bacterium]|nr:HEAT repeat domain-containing protein [Terriglobia bacterium]